MIFKILKDIFEDTNTLLLDKLWHLCEGRHRLLMKDDEDIDALKNSEWYKGLRGITQAIINDLIIWGTQSSSSLNSRITISMQAADYFTLSEAIQCLMQPFTIILENSLNDSPFVDALIKHFPKEGRIIKEHKGERWLKYGMGGGAENIRNLIETEIKSFEKDIFTKEKHKYLRCFVLVDSDKKFPEMPLEQSKHNLIDYLNAKEVEFHVLEKREMENYLPDAAFNDIQNNGNYIGAYLRLTPLQRDYFDIENGFDRGRNFNGLPYWIRELYQDITEEDKRIFRAGNLEMINDEEKRNFKSEFPKLFLSEKVTNQNLMERCSHHKKDKNELPNILKQISELL